MAIITSRRSFITGLVALVAAPAIVRASSLMPVKLTEPVGSFNVPDLLDPTDCVIENGMITQLTDMTRKAFVPRLFVQTYRVDPMLKLLIERGIAQT